MSEYGVRLSVLLNQFREAVLWKERAEHVEDCLHCMAKWALTGRYPRPER